MAAMVVGVKIVDFSAKVLSAFRALIIAVLGGIRSEKQFIYDSEFYVDEEFHSSA